MDKQQLVIIHGGNARNSYEEYLDRLKQREVTADDFKVKHKWKEVFADEFSSSWEVFKPSMPNDKNAKYLEWKIWFEKLVPYLRDDVVFIGHSLGGLFLAKYLSEEQFPKRVRATILVAAPYNTPEHPRADFNITHPFDQLVKQGGEIYLYHSPDDETVPLSAFERYAKEIPSAHAVLIENRGHFSTPTFPELAEVVRSLKL
ncbi:MAG TPA: alpha/beta fold hydrolase [Candidatus Paceibacterota bacterium]|nr:alpha/beta fold hydrolase [Candidatus Paceibacterota bacterium]